MKNNTKRTINFMVAGPLSKYEAGVRPLNNKERRNIIRLVYFLTFSWLWEQYKTTKVQEEATDDFLINQERLEKSYKENAKLQVLLDVAIEELAASNGSYENFNRRRQTIENSGGVAS